MLKIFEWLKRNPCKKCKYYIVTNNTCQSKKCATCGRHPYVNWFDRHFCEALEEPSRDMEEFERMWENTVVKEMKRRKIGE